jgi:glutathione synthase/RimK-type ligase-like ATP-grasp enzyme
MDVKGIIQISESFMKKHNVLVTPTIKIRAGAKVAEAMLRVSKEPALSYRISASLLNNLGLNSKKSLHLRYDHEHGMLQFGPIIGILTEYLPNQPEYEPKSLQAELIFLSMTGRSIPGMVYLFTPGSINWSNKTVRGSNYRLASDAAGGGYWTSSVYPLPDVVYDRVSTRRGETQSGMVKTKRKLKSLPYLIYFNPSFLNKWRVHRLLQNNEELLPYLPETKLLSRENLNEMLEKYPVLYLKPCNGSLGKGIIKVNRVAAPKIKYTVYNRYRHSNTSADVNALMKATVRHRKRKSYLVQQGLSLAKYHDCAFDIRIIYQKNGMGEWKITKKFVRVAPPGSSVSNLSRGGMVETCRKVFPSLFNKNQDLIDEKNQEIKQLCQIVAQTLESQSESTYGELGLDIGIDRNHKLWIIEVNSKPRKTTESHISQHLVRSSFRRPLEYAVHLAGYKNRHHG